MGSLHFSGITENKFWAARTPLPIPLVLGVLPSTAAVTIFRVHSSLGIHQRTFLWVVNGYDPLRAGDYSIDAVGVAGVALLLVLVPGVSTH
jgi:hypothetical protein